MCVGQCGREEVVGQAPYLLPIITKKNITRNQHVVNINNVSFPPEKDQYMYVRENMKGEATGKATYLLPVTTEKYN